MTARFFPSGCVADAQRVLLGLGRVETIVDFGGSTHTARAPLAASVRRLARAPARPFGTPQRISTAAAPAYNRCQVRLAFFFRSELGESGKAWRAFCVRRHSPAATASSQRTARVARACRCPGALRCIRSGNARPQTAQQHHLFEQRGVARVRFQPSFHTQAHRRHSHHQQPPPRTRKSAGRSSRRNKPAIMRIQFNAVVIVCVIGALAVQFMSKR